MGEGEKRERRSFTFVSVHFSGCDYDYRFKTEKKINYYYYDGFFSNAFVVMFGEICNLKIQFSSTCDIRLYFIN